MVQTQVAPPIKISLLHATRGRPEKAVECRNRWLSLALNAERVEHIFAIDSDDYSSVEGLAEFKPLIVNEISGGCVAAWNLAASMSTGNILVQLSDDWVPPKNWDELMANAIGDVSSSVVLRVSDGHRTDDLLCMAILTRARLLEQEFFFSPEYKGVFSDDEFSYRAYKDSRVVNLSNICFTHTHPHYDPTVDVDETYRVQNSESRKREGLLVFARRNPDAFGRWLHRSTDSRIYKEFADLSEIQYQVVDAVKERVRLTEKQEELVDALRQVNERVQILSAFEGRCEHLKQLCGTLQSDCDSLRNERVHLINELNNERNRLKETRQSLNKRIKDSKKQQKDLKKDNKKIRSAVDRWNRGFWLKRVFRKLRLDKAKNPKALVKNEQELGLSKRTTDKRFRVFDSSFYLKANQDVLVGGVDPFDHYVSKGAKEMQAPHPLFDPKWYAEKNPDVVAAGLDLLTHYLSSGWKEGREPHPLFDTRYFWEVNQGKVDPKQNPLVEYQRLVSEGQTIEVNQHFASQWLLGYARSATVPPSDKALAPIPQKPTSESEALAFAALTPEIAVGVILYHNSEEEVSRMVLVLDQAAKVAESSGFKRPKITFTDNSHEWTQAKIDSLSKSTGVELYFFPTEENIGFGRGHNHLMRNCFGQLGATHYFCLNPDGYLHPSAIAELYRAIAKEKLPTMIEALQFPSEHPKDYDEITLETNWCSAGCLIIPRFLFELTGGFNDAFFMYCEDVDLCWRVWELGYRCVVAPKARFHHRVASRTHNPTAEKQSLESGRFLAQIWSNLSFQHQCERYLLEKGHCKSLSELPPIPPLDKHTPHERVDFSNMFAFASFRW